MVTTALHTSAVQLKTTVWCFDGGYFISLVHMCISAATCSGPNLNFSKSFKIPSVMHTHTFAITSTNEDITLAYHHVVKNLHIWPWLITARDGPACWRTKQTHIDSFCNGAIDRTQWSRQAKICWTRSFGAPHVPLSNHNPLTTKDHAVEESYDQVVNLSQPGIYLYNGVNLRELGIWLCHCAANHSPPSCLLMTVWRLSDLRAIK